MRASSVSGRWHAVAACGLVVHLAALLPLASAHHSAAHATSGLSGLAVATSLLLLRLTAADPPLTCGPGQALLDSLECSACAPGSWLNNAAGLSPWPSACTACAPGTAAPETERSSSCDPCPLGTVSNPERTACSVACRPGEFVLPLSSACFVCREGRFAPTAMTDDCLWCGAGFSVNADVGATACTECIPGTFALGGARACEACAAGFWSGLRSGECAPCPRGMVAPLAGTGSCEPCPGNSYPSAGGVACDRCLRGFFVTDAQVCDTCPDGAVCGADGEATTATLELLDGHWRASDKTTLIHECPLAKGCVGGKAVDGYCADGFTGPLCGACDVDAGFFLDATSKTCRACEDDTKSYARHVLGSPAVVLFLFPTLCLALILVAAACAFDPSTNASPSATADAGMAGPMHALKRALAVDAKTIITEENGSVVFISSVAEDARPPSVRTTTSVVSAGLSAKVVTRTQVATTTVLSTTTMTTLSPSNAAALTLALLAQHSTAAWALTSFLQIVANVGSNCNVVFPPVFEALIDALRALNLDLVPALGLTCRWPRFDYIHRMIAVTAVPLVIGLPLLGLWWWRNSQSRTTAQLDEQASALKVPSELLGKFKPETLLELKLVFCRLDAAGTGTIGEAGLLDVCRCFDPDATQNDVVARTRSMSASNELHFGEFMFIMSEENKVVGELSPFVRRLRMVGAKAPCVSWIFDFLLALSFLVLVGTSTVVFNFLPCQEFPEIGTSYLVQDYSINCASGRYRAFLPYALVMVLVYPVGVPLWYAALIYKHRGALVDQTSIDHDVERNSLTLGHVSFLVSAYKPEYYYFAVVDCCRKVLLGSMLGLVGATNSSAAAAVLGLIISGGFIVVFSEFKPFKADRDCRLSVALSYSLAGIFLAVLLVSTGAFASSEYAQALLAAGLVMMLVAGPLYLAISTCLTTRNGRIFREEQPSTKCDVSRWLLEDSSIPCKLPCQASSDRFESAAAPAVPMTSVVQEQPKSLRGGSGSELFGGPGRVVGLAKVDNHLGPHVVKAALKRSDDKKGKISEFVGAKAKRSFYDPTVDLPPKMGKSGIIDASLDQTFDQHLRRREDRALAESVKAWVPQGPRALDSFEDLPCSFSQLPAKHRPNVTKPTIPATTKRRSGTRPVSSLDSTPKSSRSHSPNNTGSLAAGSAIIRRSLSETDSGTIDALGSLDTKNVTGSLAVYNNDGSFDGTECPVCLNPLNEGHTCTLECSHMMHTACAEELRSFGIKRVCPVCRWADRKHDEAVLKFRARVKQTRAKKSEFRAARAQVEVSKRQSMLLQIESNRAAKSAAAELEAATKAQAFKFSPLVVSPYSSLVSDITSGTWETRSRDGTWDSVESLPSDRSGQSFSASSLSREPPVGECCICLDPFDDIVGTTCTLPCCHQFHVSCVEHLRTFDIKQVCPLCRVQLPPGSEQLYQEAVLRFCNLERSIMGRKHQAPWSATTPEQKAEINDILKLWRGAADLGYARAQFALGYVICFGQGAERNQAEAHRLYQSAAEQGLACAQFNLGILFEIGEGVPVDYILAAAWYRKAAAQGHAKAQFNLGIMYEHGKGVQQDYAEAMRYYREASEQGFGKAHFNLGIMYTCGKGMQKDYVRAAALYHKAAKQGIASAQFNLGGVYCNGLGVEQNTDKALKWIKLAAAQGHQAACDVLKQFR